MLAGLSGANNNLKMIGIYFVFIVFILLTLHLSLDISKVIYSGLSREETLTGRTEIWEQLIKMDTNPWIGSGYESFWLSDKTHKVFERYTFRMNQAHNGYLEIYLNLGYIGLMLLMVAILSAFRNIGRRLLSLKDFDFQSIRMTFLILILLINITEATFKGLSLPWLFFLLVAVECSPRIIEAQLPSK
jgi:O-antigen ligase